jgi:hypothetical protein
MGKLNLDKRLAEIQHVAEQQQEAHKSSRTLLYQSLADSYVWWREASWDNAYLEKLYADNGVTVRGEKSNQITKATFRKLIKLTYVKLGQQDTHIQLITNWANALLAMHDRYSNDDSWLRVSKNNPKQATAELTGYMKDSGGIGALAAKYADVGDDEGFELTEPSPSTQTKRAPNEQRRIDNDKQLLAHKRDVLRSFNGELLSDETSFITNLDNMSVLLVRNNGKKTEVIGSSANENIINAALLDVGHIDTANVAPSLKLLCETLAMHSPPKQLKNPKSKFYEKYSINAEGADGEIVKLDGICYPRLLIQKDGSMLVSNRHMNASLTSIVKPNTPLSTGSELFMRGNDRDYLEQELISHQALPLFTAKQKARLAKTTEGVRAAKQLTLQHTKSKHERNIYFYDTTWLDVGGELKTGTPQPMVHVPAKHKFNWTLVADMDFLKSLNQIFEEWAVRKNNVFSRKSDKCIDVEVTKNELRIHTWWENGTYSAAILKAKFNKRTRLKQSTVKQSKAGVKGIRINPLDVAQLLITLPNIALLKNKVTIDGSAELLKFSYQTELASYEVYVPSSNEHGHRSDACFADYEFEQ